MSSPTCNIQGWDERAKTYSERNDLLLKTPEQRQKWTKLLLFLLNLHMEADVLDVGTGPGFLALQLAKLGYRTTGADLSTEMLRIAAEKAKSMKLNCMFIHGDAETLPFTNASFDAIVSRHLLGALSCRDRAFMEWKRLLRPGGKVVVMDGDRTARNDDPFARILPPVTRRLYRSLEREKMHVGNNQSNLQERVVLELERAGYVDIQTYTIADLFPDGERRLRRDHYQRVIVTGRKPRSQ